MGDQLITSLVTVATAVIGLAIIAVLVSGNAQTGNVLSSAGNSFAQIIGAAESPVSGGSTLGNLANTFTGSNGIL
jgi:PRD1 phage membrane DNA delivery